MSGGLVHGLMFLEARKARRAWAAPAGRRWAVELERFALIRRVRLGNRLHTSIFLGATIERPVILQGHPLTLALQVLTSTGRLKANGPYDVLAAENGLGIRQSLVDTAGIEALRARRPIGMRRLVITGPTIGRTAMEEIYVPAGYYPCVTIDGKYSAGGMERLPQPQAAIAEPDNRRRIFGPLGEEG